VTKIDDDRYADRITVHDDEKKRVIDLYKLNLVPPDVGIFDSPTRCYTVNLQWAKIIMGAVSSQLSSVASWRDANDEGYIGITESLKFLAGGNCTDCDITDMLQDPAFFEQYQAVVFGDIFTGTNEHNLELNDLYDETPQSIGENIPLSTPDALEINALCYALNSFVRLYCSYKVCIIQSKNFLSVTWNQLQSALIDAYNDAVDHAIYNFLPHLFGCFVSDSEALTVIVDTAAQEELACFLQDELKTVVMSQANFDAALSAAVAALTGNAQKIACVMLGDNNLDVYLNFLETYNLALIRVNNGETLDCPCPLESHPQIGLGNCSTLTPLLGILEFQHDDIWHLKSQTNGAEERAQLQRIGIEKFRIQTVTLVSGVRIPPFRSWQIDGDICKAELPAPNPADFDYLHYGFYDNTGVPFVLEIKFVDIV